MNYSIGRILFAACALAISLWTAQARAQNICTPYTNSPNGCSTPQFFQVDPYFKIWDSVFAGQCNAHDVCYGTLGRFKANCDDSFLGAMKNQCDSKWKPWLAPVESSACRNAAEQYYAAVRNSPQAAEAFFKEQNKAANYSYELQSKLFTKPTPTCGTDPALARVYGTSMIDHVNQRFQSVVGRSPTIFEFVLAANRYSPAGDLVTWQQGVDQVAYQSVGIWPPTLAVTSVDTGSELELTVTSTTPGTRFLWRIDGLSARYGSTISIPYVVDPYRVVTVRARGFVAAVDAQDNPINLLVVDKFINIVGECYRRLCPELM